MTDEEQKKIIAQNLQFFIDKSGKDQKQIAIDLNIPPTRFNTWVRGRALAPVSQLQRVAAYFRVGLLSIVNKGYAAAREKYLIDNFNCLNEEGKDLLVNYSKLLIKSDMYNQTDWRDEDEQTD